MTHDMAFLSVRPSVCLSRYDTVLKRMHVSSLLVDISRWRKASREKRRVLIDSEVQPTECGHDGHGGARGECDWMWEWI